MQTLVVGSLVRPSIPQADWSAALVAVPPEMTLSSFAPAANPAAVETLGSLQVVRGPDDDMYLEVLPGLLGVLTPAHRQDASRWARALAANEDSRLSPFLLQAAQLPGHIVMAMDLQDLLDPGRIRQRMASDERLLTAPEVRARLVTQLQGVQGGTVSITIGEQITARVVFTFSEPLADSARLFQRLFLDVLGEMGTGIDEFDSATTTIDGQTLVLDTTLSEASLRRILSLIVPTPPRPQSAQVASTPPATTPPAETTPVTPPKPAATTAPPEAPGAATRNYVLAVNRAIDDLRLANRNARNYERTATWHDNFARRLGDLPVTGVDTDAVAYGVATATRFRALAASLRGQEVQLATSQGTLTYNYNVDPGWGSFNIWGGIGWRNATASFESNLRDVRERQAQAIQAGAQQRTEIWQQLDNDRAAIEVALRKRYGDDFLTPSRR